MPAEWTGDVVGKLHVHGISAKSLACKLGYNSKYLSSVLNGHRTPPKAEEKCKAALNELIAEKELLEKNNKEEPKA
jgi:lambda repressor-like predicted transcriptional regulator